MDHAFDIIPKNLRSNKIFPLFFSRVILFKRFKIIFLPEIVDRNHQKSHLSLVVPL